MTGREYHYVSNKQPEVQHPCKLLDSIFQKTTVSPYVTEIVAQRLFCVNTWKYECKGTTNSGQANKANQRKSCTDQ
jgi:hypothetical protein